MKHLKYLFFAVFIASSFVGFSQKQVKQREKQLKAQEKEKKKAADDSINEGKERHMNIQTKKTKKRMKKTAKKSKRMRDGKGRKKKFLFF